jgi:hypothetical protein
MAPSEPGGKRSELVDLEIPQPKAAEIYYDTASSIDQHNRCRQDDLPIERKLSEHGTGQSGSTFRFLGCVWWISGLFIEDALVR